MSDAIMATYSRLPVTFARGEGVYLEDEQGRRYLDALSGIAVCNLGHCHPGVTRAITEQAATLVHTSNLYGVSQQQALADRLCAAADMESVFFSNSGAEANEAAIKLARLHGHNRGIEKPAIIVMEHAFHGRTLATLTATGNRKIQAGFEPLVPGFIRAPLNNLEAVRQIAENNHSVAAVLVEPIQGEGGVRPADTDYLRNLRQLCDEQGWLLMLDEVQTGNGRTGRHFAFQGLGFIPDVVTTAKGLANGVPIGACLARGAAARVLGPGHHGSTYGGNPLACAAALAVLDALQGEGVYTNAAERGEQLRNLLRDGLAGNASVRDIRGSGLMIGIELDRDCGQLVMAALEQGLLINVTAGNTVRLLPPLIISAEQVSELSSTLVPLINEFTAAAAA